MPHGNLPRPPVLPQPVAAVGGRPHPNPPPEGEGIISGGNYLGHI